MKRRSLLMLLTLSVVTVSSFGAANVVVKRVEFQPRTPTVGEEFGIHVWLLNESEISSSGFLTIEIVAGRSVVDSYNTKADMLASRVLNPIYRTDGVEFWARPFRLRQPGQYSARIIWTSDYATDRSTMREVGFACVGGDSPQAQSFQQSPQTQPSPQVSPQAQENQRRYEQAELQRQDWIRRQQEQAAWDEKIRQDAAAEQARQKEMAQAEMTRRMQERIERREAPGAEIVEKIEEGDWLTSFQGKPGVNLSSDWGTGPCFVFPFHIPGDSREYILGSDLAKKKIEIRAVGVVY